MKYNYCDLSPNQFENLVIEICFELFGMQTQAFATGPDGGRDALFNGVANEFPSRTKPWEGKTVIQAKHSLSFNCKFNDPDFYSLTAKDAVLSKEVKRIKALATEGKLSNYILFSNRKLPANANDEILKYLSAKSGLEESKICLVGQETLERYLKRFPDIPERVDLNPFDMPLDFEPDELAEVIVGIKSCLPAIKKEVIEPTDLERTSFKDKNIINNLSHAYAETILKKFGEYNEIIDFLSAPENAELEQKFNDAAEELNAKIIILKKSHHEFDEVIEKTIELVLKRDNDCKRNKRLTRTMIYYMYYLCSIGENRAVVSQ